MTSPAVTQEARNAFMGYCSPMSRYGRPVRNARGTSFRSPKPPCCTDWLTHFELVTDTEGHACANLDCDNFAEVGAHVWDLDGDWKQYLVPLCRSCNKIPDEEVFYIDARVRLVYANVRHGGSKAIRRRRRPPSGPNLGEALLVAGVLFGVTVGTVALITHLTALKPPPIQPPRL